MTTAADEPERIPVAFAHLLRGLGVDVSVAASVVYADALGAVGLDRERDVYWAGRTALVRRPEDVGTYDVAFDAFWRGRSIQAAIDAIEVVELVPQAMGEDDEDEEKPSEPEEKEPAQVLELRYSPAESLHEKDFAECTPEELAEAYRLMERFRWVGPVRRTRRRRPTRRKGDWPDVRRTVRLALRTAGEPAQRRWLDTGDRPRRTVFLCDVSGSMAPYARALLRFLHAAVAARRGIEAFTAGTRLTRVTRALSIRDPDHALARAAQTVPDWSGGTRLGEVLRDFNDLWGVRGLARGAVVVVLSDGWDRGDPALLGTEMARLARVAHRVIWVNPLKATPGYAPLVRGMAAALPYVDLFLEGNSLSSLESLARLIAGDGLGERRGKIGDAVWKPRFEGAGREVEMVNQARGAR